MDDWRVERARETGSGFGARSRWTPAAGAAPCSRGRCRPVAPGAHVLTVAVRGAADAEPRDDARLMVVTVVPTPGIVMLASPPTWESRFLLETLRDVAALPVRGYLETERGRWRRAGDLKPVAPAEVADAARRADLLIILGEPGCGRGSTARARALELAGIGCPSRERRGLVRLGSLADVRSAGAFAGAAVDSFPPGTALAELVARPARLGRSHRAGRPARRGASGDGRPGLRGARADRDGRGGSLALVLPRRAQRAGLPRAGGHVARLAAGWRRFGGGPRPTAAPGRRSAGGRAVFEWNGGGDRAGADRIAHRGDGTAQRYAGVRWRRPGRAAAAAGSLAISAEGGGQGTLAVEEYSDEWLPTPRTLAAREAARAQRVGGAAFRCAPGSGSSASAVAAFAGEWLCAEDWG